MELPSIGDLIMIKPEEEIASLLGKSTTEYEEVIVYAGKVFKVTAVYEDYTTPENSEIYAEHNGISDVFYPEEIIILRRAKKE